MTPRGDVRVTAAGSGSRDMSYAFGAGSASADTAGLELTTGSRVLSWSGYAWGAVGATIVFVGLTWWWVTQDHSIPVYDAGDHLGIAIYFHNLIQSGNVLGPFNYISQYPPLAHMVGALAAFIGGVDVSSPIVGENLVFVPLLTLGCYQTGKLLFEPRVGLLAAIFALGSPLLIAQLHVFMLDAPETAMVAVSIWLMIASERFKNVKLSALAGLAVACGMMVKVQYPFFLVGIGACALLLGGWRNWRGLLVFAVVAVALGSPWYIDHLAELKTIAKFAGSESGAIPGNTPPTLSMTNFTWYFWNILNSQLLAPLFALLLVGTVWLVIAIYRDRGEARNKRLEFFAGACVGWIAITLTPHHDIRYGMPLMPYLAVIATGWTMSAGRAVRWAAIGLLALGVGVNTLGTTFGVGKYVAVNLVSHPPATEAAPDQIRFDSNEGFLVAGPRRDGDVPGLLAALRKNGVRLLYLSIPNTTSARFSEEGLRALALIANLSVHPTRSLFVESSGEAATIAREPEGSSGLSPCVRLSDGSGIFVLRYDEATHKADLFCPFRDPSYSPV